jgi:phosphoribosylanthranilate isomerase
VIDCRDPRPFLKICGLRTAEEARLASLAGATALGFLVGLTHRAEDEVTEAEARAVLRSLPATGPTPVMVTHLPDPAAIAALAERIGAATIQVHGDLRPDGLVALRARAPGRRLLKAIHVTGPEAVAHARAFAPHACALLLDSRTADRLGGTGRTHDWTISRRIVAAVAPVPVILAGGLTPENVAAAITSVLPAGVDVNSGVEDPSGAKDLTRMRAFIAAASAALSGQTLSGQTLAGRTLAGPTLAGGAEARNGPSR